MTKQRHLHRVTTSTTMTPRIRGGGLAPDLLRADAERYHAIYGE